MIGGSRILHAFQEIRASEESCIFWLSAPTPRHSRPDRQLRQSVRIGVELSHLVVVQGRLLEGQSDLSYSGLIHDFRMDPVFTMMRSFACCRGNRSDHGVVFAIVVCEQLAIT